MGILDWLFGRKDDYGGNKKSGKVSRKTEDSSTYQTPENPPSPQKFNHPPRAQRDAHFAEPTSSTPTTSPQHHVEAAPIEAPSHKRLYHGPNPFMPWSQKEYRPRSNRSKHDVGERQDVDYESNWPNPYFWQEKFGGKFRKPAIDGEPAKIEGLGLPLLPRLDDLAQLLEVSPEYVAQFIMRPSKDSYHAHWIKKKSGKERLLLRPSHNLKTLQRKLLSQIIDRLPLQDSVHGFRRSRDVLTGASVHVGRDVLISFDIQDFFPTLTFRRVSGYFRSLGYSRGMSIALANLTTFRPRDLKGVKSTKETEHPQLPQGAPTSPGIANAICWRMDKRLSALARKFGGDYTRYADDLTFSGFDDMADNAGRLLRIVRQIIETEGFVVNENKTRIMRKGSQQRVTGVVVNEKTNLPRREFDKIKAIIHNCIKHGPASQNLNQHENFQEHLRGRVAHAMHIGPERGKKLKAMFDKIAW